MIKKIGAFLKQYYVIILCAAALILPDALMRSCVSPGVFHDAYTGICSVLFSVGWISFILIVCFAILPGKCGKAVFGILNLAALIFAFCECVYYRIFQQFFWLSGIGMAGEGREYFGHAIQSVNIWMMLLVVLTLVLMIIGIIKWKPLPPSRYTKVIGVLVPLLLIGVSHICMQPQVRGESTNGWDTWNKPAVVYSSFNDVNKSVEIAGLYQFVYRSAWSGMMSEASCSPQDIEKVDNYIQNNTVPLTENAYTGILEGKNVIVVMMESMDTWMIDPDYTPNLYKMTKWGLNFSNYNAPFFGTGFTLSSEFAFHTGLFAPSSSVSVSSFSKNSFPYAVTRLFAEKGYSTNSFHFNSREFYNRGILHKSFGYDMYHSLSDFGLTGTESELDSNMMEWDAVYRKMTEGDPFFSFVITYSPHLPYTDDSEKLQLAKSYYPELIGEEDEKNNMLILAADTDRFFGRLIERLEADGLMDDTVIVAFTDHYAYGVSDELLLADWKGNTLKYTVPAFIYAEDLDPEVISKPMMTVDWAPTLVNLFALDNSGRYLGNDILHPDNEGFVYFETRDWIDGKYHYVQAEKKVPAERMVQIVDNNRKVQERIEVNDIIVIGDYYKQD